MLYYSLNVLRQLKIAQILLTDIPFRLQFETRYKLNPQIVGIVHRLRVKSPVNFPLLLSFKI